MGQFYVEVTDMFAGELNYSWVSRYIVTASSDRGAIWMVSRYMGGAGFQSQSGGIYHSKSSCIGAWLESVDNEDVLRLKNQYSKITEI